MLSECVDLVGKSRALLAAAPDHGIRELLLKLLVPA